MKNRCNNLKNINSVYYGRKGIKVCPEWNKSFTDFYSWAIENGYTKFLSIDRIDNNKGYSPENCRWVSIADQARNKTNNVKINNKIAKDLADELNVSHGCITKRIKNKWSEPEIRKNPKRIKIMKLPKYIVYEKSSRTYRVRIGSSGKKHLGRFKTLTEAKECLKKALQSK